MEANRSPAPGELLMAAAGAVLALGALILAVGLGLHALGWFSLFVAQQSGFPGSAQAQVAGEALWMEQAGDWVALSSLAILAPGLVIGAIARAQGAAAMRRG